MPSPPHHLLRLDVSPAAFRVMVALYARVDAQEFAAHQRGEGPPAFAWPTNARLMEDTGLGRSTVIAATGELAAAGVVRRAMREGQVGWELIAVRGDQITGSRNLDPRPDLRTPSRSPDPVQISGPPEVPPSHTLPSPNPSEPTREIDTAQAHAREDMTDETGSFHAAPIPPPRSDSVRGLGGVQLRPPGADGRVVLSTHAAPSPAVPVPPEAPPGLVAEQYDHDPEYCSRGCGTGCRERSRREAEGFGLEPSPTAPARRRGARKTPPRGPPDEHPGVRAALDSLHLHRQRGGLTNRKERRQASPADVALLERPLRELELCDGTGALDWTVWPVVIARMFESIRRAAGGTDPKRFGAQKSAEYFHLEHLSRPGNFRRYWDRDELDRVLELDDAPPPAPRARAPGPTRDSYTPGKFTSGESDMENGT